MHVSLANRNRGNTKDRMEWTCPVVAICMKLNNRELYVKGPASLHHSVRHTLLDILSQVTEIQLCISSDQHRVEQGLLSEHSGNIHWTFSEHSVNIQRILRIYEIKEGLMEKDPACKSLRVKCLNTCIIYVNLCIKCLTLRIKCSNICFQCSNLCINCVVNWNSKLVTAGPIHSIVVSILRDLIWSLLIQDCREYRNTGKRAPPLGS
jgi:hypothetical protein